MQNYFEILNFQTSFVLDLAQLEKHYFDKQRQFHPDRMVGKNPAQRQAATLQSMQINEAYETLKNPLSRAQHMLALKGIRVGGENDSMKPPQELLIEIMEMREAIAEIKSAEELTNWRNRVVKEKAGTLAALAHAFASEDLQSAAEQTIRLGYLNKIQDDIRVAGKRF